MAGRKKREPVLISTNVADAVSTAFCVIEELAEEMREAYDNTPESLQNSGAGEARGEAADNLENISEPDVPDALNQLPVNFNTLPLRRNASRADRLADGLQYACQAIGCLEDLITEHLKEEGDTFGELDEDAVREVIDEIQNMIDEAEGVEFPGMFG